MPTRVISALLLCVALAAQAAPHPFYLRMLERGASNVQLGRNEEAIKELKIAAFGLVNDVAAYQRAQIYLAIANERSGRPDDARMAATKLLQAERISSAYATIEIDAPTRAAFEKIAASAADPAYLATIPSFRRSAPREVSTVASNSQEALVTQATTEADTTTPGGEEVPLAAVEVPPVAQPAPAAEVVVNQPVLTPQVVSAIATRIETASQLASEGKRGAARQEFLAIAGEPMLPRSQMLQVAEGLNRLGAWRESSEAYARSLPWSDGDEPHMFLEAVNRYESGERAAARLLLERALPKLPPSREVAIYRGMIEAGTRLP